MKYYLMKCGYDLLAAGPHNVDGDYFSCSGPHAYEASIVSAIVPDANYDDRMLQSGDLTDFITFGGIYFCISPKVRELLGRVRCDPEMKCVPTELRNQAGVLIATYYYVWSPAGRHHVVDHDRAQVEYYSKGKVVAEVLTMRIDVDKVPPYHLFCVEACNWIATETVQAMFESNGISNVSFEPID